jgi:hypothetical protein
LRSFAAARSDDSREVRISSLESLPRDEVFDLFLLVDMMTVRIFNMICYRFDVGLNRRAEYVTGIGIRGRYRIIGRVVTTQKKHCVPMILPVCCVVVVRWE